jgi:exopolysaccharide biosynthesis polyprenyl glycosylphosphotransferase
MDFNRQFARRRLILLMDATSIVMSMVLAAATHAVLRSHFAVFKNPPSAAQYLLIAALTVPLMLSLVAAFGLHRLFERPFRVWQVFWDQLKLHLSTLVGIALVVFLTQVPLNRTIVGLFLVYTFVFMLGSRLLLDRWRKRSHAAGQGRAHLLIVGSDQALVEHVIDSALTEDLPPQLVGILESDGEPRRDRLLGVPILGGLDALERVLHEETVDEVVLATHTLPRGQFARVLAACDDLGTPMRQLVLPEFHEGRRLGLERQYGLPFVTLVRTERSTEALAIKRGIDLLGSAAALALLAPVMLLIALTIFLTMGRPVLFSQDRIGYHGRRFRMHKFRSMVNDAERQREALEEKNEMGGPVFKVAADPRITPFGRFIRKYSLDELPQLLNVLSGSMSLVGPRPLPVKEQQQITGALRRRLSMKPGITGLWQVSGRSNLSFEEWMKMDLEYLDNWSNLEDLRLLVLTLPAVVAGRGAK